MPHIETSSPNIPSPRPQTILSTTMISTEIQPSDASIFHTQPFTVQQPHEDVHSEALSTQNPPSISKTLSARNADNQEPVPTFTLFPLVPIELRLRVWRLATFPRLVRFVTGGGKAPSVLSACRESRTETRRMYGLCIRPSSPVPHNPNPGFQVIPDYGFFINSEVDIIHANPLNGFWNMIEKHVWASGNLIGHEDALRILDCHFPLWHLPAKRILFELPGDPAPLSENTYYLLLLKEWAPVFRRTALLFPLLEEIMLLRSEVSGFNQQDPVHMVSASNANDANFLDAVKAFTEAEKVHRKDNHFFSRVRTEREAIQRIMEAPKVPEGPRSRSSECWWDNNPKLTFVEIEKQ